MNLSPRSSASGFTLIEVLVALLIFAIVGVISSQLLTHTINSHENLSARGQRLADIHRAMQIVQRDVMQLTNRSIRDEYGDVKPPLLIGVDGTIEFTRAGWRNPLQLPRAQVQRVGYLWQDNQLIRGYWPVLDRAQDTIPAYQVLLENVAQVEFYAVDASGNQNQFWPIPGNVSGPGSPTNLMAILMRIDIPPFGVVERIWEVPSL